MANNSKDLLKISNIMNTSISSYGFCVDSVSRASPLHVPKEKPVTNPGNRFSYREGRNYLLVTGDSRRRQHRPAGAIRWLCPTEAAVASNFRPR